MKTFWQELQQRLAAGLAAARASFGQLIAQAGLVRWRVVLGSLAGVALAALIYSALSNQTMSQPPGRLLAAGAERKEIAQRIRAGFPSRTFPQSEDIHAYLILHDSLRKITAHLQKQDADRHSLTFRKLLDFRQQVITQNGRLYDGLNIFRNLNSPKNIELKIFASNDLVENQASLLAVLDSIQQDLAIMQLAYLQQPSQRADSLSRYRLALARLQLSDSHDHLQDKLHPADLDTLPVSPLLTRPTPRQTALTRQKLALANVLELQQGEAATNRDAITRQLLDSCQREVYLLRWLDSCRAQQSWHWFTADSTEGFNLTRMAAAPYPSQLLANEAANNLLKLLLRGLAVLMFLLPFVLLGLSRRQSRQELQAAPTPPARELEPPLFQFLLRAYAGHLRTLLRTPRQIKRFAGKARLQHHLLGALAQQSGETGFTFGPAEQVLAFVLLLLLEEGAQASHHLPQSEATFAQHLRDAYQQALAAGRLNAALPRRFVFRQGKVWLRLAQANADGATRLAFSVAFAEGGHPAKNQEMLLQQLYWLNTGLLV